MNGKLGEIERFQPADRAAWRAWLAAQHAQSNGVWVITYKKAAGIPSPSYDELVCEALCFGWVDSRPAKLDSERTMLLMSPRRPQSAWSRPNKERIALLEAQGLMAQAGRLAVERAKLNGAWEKLDLVEELTVPSDLAQALEAEPEAARQFTEFPRSAKRGILEWIEQARRPETRAKRVAETVDEAKQGRRANAWPRPPRVSSES